LSFFTSIAAYQQALRLGTTSCEAAVQHYLHAIEAHRHLNAFVEVWAAEALDRARALDAAPARGRLHGVVIGIKDNICYADHTVSAASRMLQSFTSTFSATAVERLLAEGAIIIGRQNCDEFGMGATNEYSAYGPVQHPTHPGHVPGGSSGGSAAAVKAGLCMAALGSDTGGSVRQPANHCGVVGLKPGYGRVSRHGLIAYASSFDCIGILATHVEDAALLLEVIEGPDDFDATAFAQKPVRGWKEADDRPSRMAYFPEWIAHPSIDPEIRASLQAFIADLENRGHRVTPVSFPLIDYIVPAYYILTTAEASSNLARYDGVRYGRRAVAPDEDLASFYGENRTRGFGPEVRRRMVLGSFVLSTGYFEAYFSKAQQVRQLLVQQTQLIFNEFDFIIAPNAPGVAPKAGQLSADPVQAYMADIFTVFANLTAVPALSLPLFKHSSNLPFGVQIMAAGQNEVSLLRFTHQLMQQ